MSKGGKGEPIRYKIEKQPIIKPTVPMGVLIYSHFFDLNKKSLMYAHLLSVNKVMQLPLLCSHIQISGTDSCRT